MKISKKEQQSIRLVMRLAQQKGQMTLPELARSEHLSQALVAKVMGRLKRGGLVSVSRGRTGGYALVEQPESLPLSAILRAVGGPLVRGCFNSGYETADNPCPHVSDCGLRPVWEYLQEKVTTVFDQVTLADLLQSERDVRALISRIRKE